MRKSYWEKQFVEQNNLKTFFVWFWLNPKAETNYKTPLTSNISLFKMTQVVWTVDNVLVSVLNSSSHTNVTSNLLRITAQNHHVLDVYQTNNVSFES